MEHSNLLHIGTCSWKYDSWGGLIYPKTKGYNYLKEYSRHYSTVEVDQWFWSLFPGDKVVLPQDTVVRDYADSVPKGFLFSIKAPNSITLTHYYSKDKNEPLIPNPHFLSIDLMKRFLERLDPLDGKLGTIVFQFEYLNKQKMANRDVFLTRFCAFADSLPKNYSYCVETRNPNYLSTNYFDFLIKNRMGHVFLQGYYMPSIFTLYEQYKERLGSLVVIRLHGKDRKAIEDKTGRDWSQIVTPRDDELQSLAVMLKDLRQRGNNIYLYVNNHFEGSAPRTIGKISSMLDPDQGCK